VAAVNGSDTEDRLHSTDDKLHSTGEADATYGYFGGDYISAHGGNDHVYAGREADRSTDSSAKPGVTAVPKNEQAALAQERPIASGTQRVDTRLDTKAVSGSERLQNG
jgi:hypothetical protein